MSQEKKKYEVTILLPAFNEEQAIALALTASAMLARTRLTEEKPGPFTVTASIAATLLILVNLVTAIWLLI